MDAAPEDKRSNPRKKIAIQILAFQGVSAMVIFFVAWYWGGLVVLPLMVWGMFCFMGVFTGNPPGIGSSCRRAPDSKHGLRIWWLLSALLTMAVLIGILWVRGLQTPRSGAGRVVRHFQGEAGAHQTAHDLVEDINSRPSLAPLQSWATNTLARYRNGQVETNGPSDYYSRGTIRLATNEIPDFLHQQEDWMSGHFPPEISVKLTEDGKPASIVIAWYLHGIVVGPKDLPRIRSWYVAEVRPGLFVYHGYK